MAPLALLMVGVLDQVGEGGKAHSESLKGEVAELLPFLGFRQQRPGLYPPQLLALQRGREGFQIRIYGINGFFSAFPQPVSLTASLRPSSQGAPPRGPDLTRRLCNI